MCQNVHFYPRILMVPKTLVSRNGLKFPLWKKLLSYWGTKRSNAQKWSKKEMTIGYIGMHDRLPNIIFIVPPCTKWFGWKWGTVQSVMPKWHENDQPLPFNIDTYSSLEWISKTWSLSHFILHTVKSRIRLSEVFGFTFVPYANCLKRSQF